MSSMVTYPGTVSPLRGLSPFSESEREVLYGRDADRDELTRMVTDERFRAGLLYGDSGVGKTSLLRAGLVPHLRDHGVSAFVCDDIHRPADSLARAIIAATGTGPAEGELAIDFVQRFVEQAMAGQLYIFVLDDIEDILSIEDEDPREEVRDLYTRLVTRAGGRARFLFCCASDQVHHFTALERRTGSLFPPSSRYALQPFAPEVGAMVLDRTLALAGVATDPSLAQAIIKVVSQGGPVLPAQVQVVALALRELAVTSGDHLARLGGPVELERAWIRACAAATGNEKSALRLLAELAADRHLTPYVADWAAARASLDPGFARHAFAVLRDKGLVREVSMPVERAEAAVSMPDTYYALAHEVLAPPVREIAAPARQAARRAFELLGSKVAERKRLTVREYLDVRRDGIVPATPEERAVIERSKRLFLIVAGAIVATPLLILIIIWFSISGSYYLDTAPGPGGGADRVVVRAGSPGLSAFHWLPGSPSFGSIVADTGFTEPMITAEAWKKVRGHDITGDLGGDGFSRRTVASLDPTLKSLIEYGSTGSAEALAELRKAAEGPDDMVALLLALRSAARGTEAEVELIQAGLNDASPAVQAAALGVAATVAREGGKDAYNDTLVQALASSDGELRRLAFTAVSGLGDKPAGRLFRAALAANPEPEARKVLLDVVTASDAAADTPSAESAASILVNRDISAATREKSRTLLRRAFTADPKAATSAAANLARDSKAPPEDRVLALELIFEFAPEDTYEDLSRDVREVLQAKAEPVRAAALPLYARIAPKDAAAELVLIPERGKPSTDMRQAMALAWGEVAKTKDRAAAGALELLLKDNIPSVRSAAARAYGNVGRAAQSPLIKLIKTERFDVAVGAAYGLANSADVGASTSVAVGGIAQLWKKKGRARRAATEVYAKMARKKPRQVIDYLASAVRNAEDTGLHQIGVEGVCNAIGAGYKYARRTLIRAADDSSVEVRRRVIECVVDNPSSPQTSTAIATELVDDVDASIRADAARVLAAIAVRGSVTKGVSNALVKLANDDDRDVRIIAIRALAALGSKAPKATAKALQRAFERATPDDKLVLLRAAREIGASELVQQAIIDASAPVRIAALDTAIATGTNVAVTINTALTDKDPVVRRAALERLSRDKDRIAQDALDKALALAVRDPDPAIGALALESLARLGALEQVTARLRADLASRSERERAQAAAACRGLVDRDNDLAIELLEPLLDDPSHDVRVAMLPALAAAYANKNEPEPLVQMLRGAEKHAMRRLVATAAFLVLADRTKAGREAAQTALAGVAEKGPPLAKVAARLGLGLTEGATDGLAFLQTLVP